MAEGFSGMDQLLADLAQLPEESRREAGKLAQGEANGMAAEVRQGYAYGETGNLIRGVVVEQRGPNTYRVRSRAPHAHLWEFGTVIRKHRSGKSVGQMFGKQGGSGGSSGKPAKPTFVPAAVRHRNRLERAYENLLRRMKVRGMTGSAL